MSLVKSDKGSLGFTLTKGNDLGCYIHDIIQDPAKGDGRLRPGDRMIMVVFPHWNETVLEPSYCVCSHMISVYALEEICHEVVT